MYDRMYYYDGRIRYSEVDSEGKLTIVSLLDYFQDCSTFHSEDLGLGVEYLREHGLVWVLASWQIVVERSPRLCERVEIGTAPYEFKAFMGMRNFAMTTPQGECLAKANSVWTLLDVNTGKPALPTEEMLNGYVIREKLDMEYAPRKIVIPGEGTCREPIVVKKHHLDTNHHVNNGQYVAMALEFVPEHFPIHQLRAEYKRQAFLDTVLVPRVAVGERSVTVDLSDEQGAMYFAAEFTA